MIPNDSSATFQKVRRQKKKNFNSNTDLFSRKSSNEYLLRNDNDQDNNEDIIDTDIKKPPIKYLNRETPSKFSLNKIVSKVLEKEEFDELLEDKYYRRKGDYFSTEINGANSIKYILIITYRELDFEKENREILLKNRKKGEEYIDIKEKSILKKRLIYNLTANREITPLPNFLKYDSRSGKCRDILTFNEGLTMKKVSYEIKNYYDESPCLALRSLFYAKAK